MNVDYQLRQAVDGELGSDERLIWCGKPNPNRALGAGLGAMLFGISFTLFALFWIITSMRISDSFGNSGGAGIPTVFPLFGIPFVLVGLGLLSSPLWMARRLSNTVYALTNRRALIISQGWTRSVQSYTPDSMGDLERRERADGSGDLIFARRLRSTTHFDGSMPNSLDAAHRYHHGTHTHLSSQGIGFFGISNVREVEKLLRGIFPHE